MDSLKDAAASAKCHLVWNSAADLLDTPVDTTAAPKYFQMLLDPAGVKQSVLRLCK